MDTTDIIIDLIDVWTIMEEIEDMINDMDLDDIKDISIDPSTDFTNALNKALDMKL